MSIYSTHAARGKHQIMVTFESNGSWVSEAVTSVDDPALAQPLTRVLNTISRCIWSPIAVGEWDDEAFIDDYTTHTFCIPSNDQDDDVDRDELLMFEDGMSRWYAITRVALHFALDELDALSKLVPGPVALALRNEVTTEVNQASRYLLRAFDAPDPGHPRAGQWGMPILSNSKRRRGSLDPIRVDEEEEGPEHLVVLEGLRRVYLLYRALIGCHPDLEFDMEYWQFSVEERTDNDEALEVSLGVRGKGRLGLSIARWYFDDDEDDYEPEYLHVLRWCDLGDTDLDPAMMASVFAATRDWELVRRWAQTPVGDMLEGTTIKVTGSGDDDHASGGRIKRIASMFPTNGLTVELPPIQVPEWAMVDAAEED